MVDKRKFYKTAYSPMYKKFVGIKSVHYDNDGNPIFVCFFDSKNPDEREMFRENELKNFVL